MVVKESFTHYIKSLALQIKKMEVDLQIMEATCNRLRETVKYYTEIVELIHEETIDQLPEKETKKEGNQEAEEEKFS